VFVKSVQELQQANESQLITEHTDAKFPPVVGKPWILAFISYVGETKECQ